LKMGFIVNPIAGLGGKVGLKGTDNVLAQALAMGAKPVSPVKAVEFLRRLKKLEIASRIEALTCPSIMGEKEAKSAHFKAKILPMMVGHKTSAKDTKTAAKQMIKKSIDLIVFVGGDGTAKDILDALTDASTVPVLGVPSGVKMYSGIFAASVLDAVDVIQAFAEGQAQITDMEIIDADEEAIRGDCFSTKLYGFLKGPFVPMHILGDKHITPETLDEHDNQMATAKFILEEMHPDATYILGPGTTVKCLADLLGIEKTLLGVDIYRNKKTIKDVNEQKILSAINDWKNAWIIVSPIGHQGMLLGRGNQQLSPEIIRRIGKNHLIVVATKGKIQGFEGGVLHVDSGDPEVDEMLRGYIKVATDYREWRLMQIV
jgi:predicted polyphosphate/ATP-dependent NAD kinase